MEENDFKVELDFSNVEIIEASFKDKKEATLKQLIDHLRYIQKEHLESPITEPLSYKPSGKQVAQQMIQEGWLPLSLYLSIEPAIENPYNPYILKEV